MGNTQAVIELKDESQQLQEQSNLVTQAGRLPITTDSEAATAGVYAQDLQAFVKKAEEYFAPEIEQAHKLHKSLTAKRAAVVDPVKTALRALADRIAAFNWKRQQEQEAKERKAREAAEAKEAKIKQELEEKAKAAEEAGDVGKADGLRIQAENTVVAARTVAAPPKIAGVAVREVWQVEILDPNKVPVKWFNSVDEARLIRAKSADQTLDVPGVRFYKKAQAAVRGSK